MKIKLLMFVALAAVEFSAFAKPVIWWASYPVKPGEHVLISGGGWTKDIRVKVKGGGAERTLRPTTVSDTGVTFLWPKDLDVKMLSVSLSDETGESKSLVLNSPTVWWMHGDDFDASTPGSELRIFGRSLKSAEVKIKDSSGKSRFLAKTFDDDYSLTATLPADLPTGDCEISLQPSSSPFTFTSIPVPWRIKVAENFWTTNVFRVVDFGAVPDDGLDDDQSVHAAIDAAAKAGGGTILFPRGRIEVHSKLDLPPHTRLKGVSRDVSGIYWQDFFNPPDILLTGEHSFGAEDLFLTCGLCKQGIRPKGLPTHDFYLRRLRVRILSDQWRDNVNWRDPDYTDFLWRFNMSGPGIQVYRGKRVWIEDVDMFWDKNSIGAMTTGSRMYINAEGVVLRNCSLRGGGYVQFCLRRAVVEKSEISGATVSIPPGTREMFWSANKVFDRYAGDREAITQDLRQNAYVDYQPAGVVDGVNVKMVVPDGIGYSFAWGRNPGWNYLHEWDGGNIQIVAGRGLGQVRKIVKAVSKYEYVIDRPFELQPDETSRFSVRYVRQHNHYVDNDLRDAHVAIQLYGGASDCIVARNTSLFAGGFIGHGVNNKGGVMPCYDCQFLDNKIFSSLEGYRALATPTMIGHPPMATWRSPFCSARGFVLKGNELEGGALALGCPDGIAEGNVVRHSAVGFVEAGFEGSHIVTNNVYEDVGRLRARRWTQSVSNAFEEQLVWTCSVDPATSNLVREAKFTVTEGAPVAMRYWCDDFEASAHFDKDLALKPHPLMDRRQRKVYLFAPGDHVIRVIFSAGEKTVKGKKFHLDLLGDDSQRILKR